MFNHPICAKQTHVSAVISFAFFSRPIQAALVAIGVLSLFALFSASSLLQVKENHLTWRRSEEALGYMQNLADFALAVAGVR